MKKVFIYADTPQQAAELAAFSTERGLDPVALLLPVGATEDYAASGCSQVVVLDNASDLVEAYARSLAQYLEQEAADAFLVAATSRAHALAASVAGYLNCPMASDVSSLELNDEGFLVSRLLYGGAVTQQELIKGFSVISVPIGLFEAAAASDPEIKHVELAVDPRLSLESVKSTTYEGGDITKADRVVGIGMGFKNEADLEIAQQLAGVLQAEIGGTRGISEERHWLAKYIGISGLTIKPSLYIAAGVSGQIQHIFGVRDSKIIVAINTNADAAVFKAADYGIVGDLKEVLPLLIQAVSK